MLLFYFIHLFIASYTSFSIVTAFNVSSPADVTLPTHQADLQYEGTQFAKRVKNDSIHLVLEFNVINLDSADVELKWELNGQTLSVEKPRKNSLMYADTTYDESTKTLNVKLNLKDASAVGGEYKLTVVYNGFEASGHGLIQFAPILPIFSKPKRVLQGDSLRVSCKVDGYPAASEVEWLFAKISIDQSDDKMAINEASHDVQPIDFSSKEWAGFASLSSEDGTVNDTLRITELKTDFNGLYACKVQNSLGKDTTLLLVSVKDRWAALWPFIGIVIEVTVLVAAILLYERHQMRAKPSSNANNTTTDHNAVVDNNAAVSPNGLHNDKGSKPEDVRQRSTTKA